jgi:hypothetical protein
MDINVSIGPNLGLTNAIEVEYTRHGAYLTRYVTIGCLHLIVSRRIRSESRTKEEAKGGV